MKTIVPVFTGKILHNRITLDDAYRFVNYKRTLEGKKISLILDKLRNTRSVQQNKYYWGVVIPLIAEHCGYTLYEHEKVHEILKGLFLTDIGEIKTKKGIKVVRTVKSTTKLTTMQFEEYLSQIRTWASLELNLYIPEPNEVELM